MSALAKREFTSLAESARGRIEAVLPPGTGMTAERFIQTVQSVVARTPAIAECSADSIVKAMIQSAELGIIPNTAKGHAYLVPYNNKKKFNEGGRVVERFVMEATFQMGYKGYVYLGMSSGFRVIDARIVYAKDDFDLSYNPSPVFHHRPFLGEDRGNATHYYAYAETQGGSVIFEVATKLDIEKIRLSARSKDSPAWRNWYDQMALGKAIKRMMRDQPIDNHLLQRSFEIDDEHFRDALPEQTPRKAISRSEALSQVLDIDVVGDDEELPPTLEELGDANEDQ